MRTKLSDLLTEAAVNDSRVMILSGDHGYALFDSVRRARPDQFVNVGVAEQTLIGIAAGMAKAGYLPIAYGLAAFLPIRVLEQIKLDLCISKLPVLLLGDGAGLVYSTLGSSHQCAEDIAALRPMPNIRIYSPADEFELEAVFREVKASFTTRSTQAPAYMRIGKSDRPSVHTQPLVNADLAPLRKEGKRILLIGTGSMASSAIAIARSLDTDALSVIRIKPLPPRLLDEVMAYDTAYVLEEHNRAGGLFSAIAEAVCGTPAYLNRPRVVSISLRDQFAEHCGGHEYALSEHGMTNAQIQKRIQEDLMLPCSRPPNGRPLPWPVPTRESNGTRT